MERTLQHIDGVVQGRVHIVIPANDPLSDVTKPSSAAVFVKYRPPADPAALGPLVRSLVRRGIEGLAAEHVSVAFVVGEPSPMAQPVKLVHWLGLKVAADAVPWLWLLLVLPLLVLGAYAGVRSSWFRSRPGAARPLPDDRDRERRAARRGSGGPRPVDAGVGHAGG